MTNGKKLTLDIQELPRRQPGRKQASGGGRRGLALLLLALMAAGAGGLWIARNPELREEVASKAETVSGALTGAGELISKTASSAKQLFGGTPATPPVGQSGTGVPGSPQGGQAPAMQGAVEGQAVTGGAVSGANSETVSGPLQGAVDTVTSPLQPLDGGASERGALSAGATALPAEGQGRQDDAVVKVGFIVDLAKWMVEGYQPSPNGRTGTLTAGVQGANLRYGAGMRGLAWIGDDLPKGRTEAIRYVYTPGMLDALYKLYITRFMNEMAETVESATPGGKALTPAQKSDVYRAYAKRFRGLSGALQSVGAVKDFATRMEGLRVTTQNVVDANARYSELVFELDSAREAHNAAVAERLGSRVQTAGQAYQQTVIKREQEREALVAVLRQNPSARLLDDETLLFVAHWVERRVRGENPDTAMDATLQAATLFLDLAARFEVAAGVIS